MRALLNSGSVALATALFVAVVLGTACDAAGPDDPLETGQAALEQEQQWQLTAAQLLSVVEAHPGAIFVDVSPADQLGSLPGACVLPVDSPGYDEHLANLANTGPLVLYSVEPADSLDAAATLLESGHADASVLLPWPADDSPGPTAAETITKLPESALAIPLDRIQAVPILIRPFYFPTFIEVAPRQALNLMYTIRDLVIVDISHNFSEGHIPDAVNYPHGHFGTVNPALLALDKSVPYLLYGPSEAICEANAWAMIDAGFTLVFRLRGGMHSWEEAGYQVEYGDGLPHYIPHPGILVDPAAELLNPDRFPTNQTEVVWEGEARPPAPR